MKATSPSRSFFRPKIGMWVIVALALLALISLFYKRDTSAATDKTTQVASANQTPSLATNEISSQESFKKAGATKKKNPAEGMSQEELIAYCQSKLDRATTISQEYLQNEAVLFQQHPEIPPLKELILNGRGELYQDLNPIIDEITLYINDAKFKELWSKVIQLKQATSMPAVLDDPIFSTYVESLYLQGKTQGDLIAWIKHWDRLAGLEPSPTRENLSLQEFKQLLQQRAPLYERHIHQLITDHNIPSNFVQLVNRTAVEDLMVDVAFWYVESHYINQFQELRREMNGVHADFYQSVEFIQSESIRSTTKKQMSVIHFPDLGNRSIWFKHPPKN